MLLETILAVDVMSDRLRGMASMQTFSRKTASCRRAASATSSDSLSYIMVGSEAMLAEFNRKLDWNIHHRHHHPKQKDRHRQQEQAIDHLFATHTHKTKPSIIATQKHVKKHHTQRREPAVKREASCRPAPDAPRARPAALA
jgi:hypothetical protein